MRTSTHRFQVKSLVFFTCGLLLALGQSSLVSASCWASNPDGIRVCQLFLNPNDLKLKLCEDKPGDCSKVGYRLITRAPLAPKVEAHSKQTEGTISAETEPKPSQIDDRSEETGVQPIDSPQDGFTLLFIAAGIILAVILLGGVFGLDAGTSLLVFFIGLFLGAISGSRRRRWH
jgi:hypothetical protein